MDSKSLMIGDWCKMKLSFGATWFTDKVGCINPDNEMEYEPIPLTTEILEKNGWKEYPQVYCSQKTLNFDIYRFEDEVGVKIQGNCIVLNYVHELQHALRLCGLNDLADNFKVA